MTGKDTSLCFELIKITVKRNHNYCVTMFLQISYTFQPKRLNGNSISLKDKYGWEVLLVNRMSSLRIPETV